MLFDNIQLRVKQNALSSRLLQQAQLNVDVVVSQYFKGQKNDHLKELDRAAQQFRDQLTQAKNLARMGQQALDGGSLNEKDREIMAAVTQP